MSIDKDQVIEVLKPVQDPELHRSIVELGMVRDVEIELPRVVIGIDLTIPGCPLKDEINSKVSEAVKSLEGVEEVLIEFGSMSEEQLGALRDKLGASKQSSSNDHGHGHNHDREIPFSNPDSKTRVLLIASGKGGVGKSSVTANLAVSLANQGKQVGVLDADVWGFSIPRILGVDRDPTIVDEMIIPPENHGVKCVSMGFFVDEAQPVIWRGPMLHKALEQFLVDVFWDQLDYLLIDLPPGTGDISLSLAQFLPNAELIVVTTPQPVAQKVAQRAGYMANKVKLKVVGVIENMSWFTGDDGKRYELFGSGGGQELAEDLKVPLLAQIPLNISFRQGADVGEPKVLDSDSDIGTIFANLADKIDTELKPKQVRSSKLKILNND